jgi:FtsH-binding integral membrane protein
MVNVNLLIAAAVATVAISLHIYTFEVWIWPKLKDEGFPAFPFGPPKVVKGFYRTVWHFFTVNLLVTIVVNVMVAFGNLIPYGMLLINALIVFWALIVVEIFVVGALSLEPGDSYIKTMARAFQWVIVLTIIFFMYRGTKA